MNLILKENNREKHTTFDNVKRMHDELIPEEFPEGSFGSPIRADEPVTGKSTPWEEGQQRKSPYSYPYEEIHEDLPRQAPGAYPLNRGKEENDETEK